MMSDSSLSECAQDDACFLQGPHFRAAVPSNAFRDHHGVHSDGCQDDDSLTSYGCRIKEEVARFTEEKKRQVIAEADDAWRVRIRRQMEADLKRRVREALETPPPDFGQMKPPPVISRKPKFRNIHALEKLNAHVERDLARWEPEYARNQRWRVMQAKKRMAAMSDSDYNLDTLGAGDSMSRYTLNQIYADEPHIGDINGYSAGFEYESRWGSGYKNESDYLRVSHKAMSNFGNLSDSEKHEFFYAFTRRGFMDALRTGRLPDGTPITDVGNGRYTDKYGIVRDEHGPFWPSDYGPLHPTPVLKGSSQEVPREDFYNYAAERYRRTVDSQSTVYTHRWRGVQILFDSERTSKDFIPPPVPEGACPSLAFESRFECGNLRQARRVGQFEYELVLKTDLYTKRHTQWYYFRVKNAVAGITYKFRIINLLKRESLYNHGMRPLLYTERLAQKGIGWSRTGHHINYSRNVINLQCPLLSREIAYFMLEWQMEFKHTDDTCYLAHCYPYTYSDLKNDLDTFLTDTDRSNVMKREVMCETRAGNSCFLLTVTNFDEDPKDKKGVIVTGRVHPGETNSSWMMRGLLDYITGPSSAAKELRKNFVFKIVPMLNPDGVIVGNYRCSLAARDLNRNYRHPRKESFPTIWHTKAMMEEMCRCTDVLVYCDLHGHSRKQNVFMYGCNVSGNTINGANSAEAFLQERLFPWLMSQKVPDKFNFNGCKFQIRRCKVATGRVVMFQQLNIDNSFTMEATFCGSTICKGTKRHFNTQDLEDMGRAFCDVVLDYHKTRADKAKMSEVILDLTRAITQQILETRGLLPLNLPCLATQPGREKLKEMVACGEVKQVHIQNPLPSSPEKVEQTFVKLIEEHSNPIRPEINGESDENIKDICQGQGKSNLSKSTVNNMLDKLSEQTIDGCVRILEQLHLVESVLESDSSDSDSESDAEMKWVEPRPKKKKKKKKPKQEKVDSASRKKQVEMAVDPSPPKPPADLGLPAIQNADKERNKKQNQSMGKYVKSHGKSYPAFVNKYDKRSNGGIPCFSEERLNERAARKKQEMKKRLEDEQKQRNAMYYVGQFDLDPAHHALIMPSQLPSQHLDDGQQNLQHLPVHMELRQQLHQALGDTPLHLRMGYVHNTDRVNSTMNGNIHRGHGSGTLKGHRKIPHHYRRRRYSTFSQHPNESTDSSGSSNDEVVTRSKGISMKAYSSTNSHHHNFNHLHNRHATIARGYGHPRHVNSATAIPLSYTTNNMMVAPITKAATDLMASTSSAAHHLPKHNPMTRNGTQLAEGSSQKNERAHRKVQHPVLSREYTDHLLQKLRLHKSSSFSTTHPFLVQKRQPTMEPAITSTNRDQ